MRTSGHEAQVKTFCVRAYMHTELLTRSYSLSCLSFIFGGGGHYGVDFCAFSPGARGKLTPSPDMLVNVWRIGRWGIFRDKRPVNEITK